MLIDMSNKHLREQETSDKETTQLIFDDPVGYLAQYGIGAQVIAETTLPAAA
jgi:hypothetical protein